MILCGLKHDIRAQPEGGGLLLGCGFVQAEAVGPWLAHLRLTAVAHTAGWHRRRSSGWRTATSWTSCTSIQTC